MTQSAFETLLQDLCALLAEQARTVGFADAASFERSVRERTQELLVANGQQGVNFTPHPQAFPDVEVGAFGIEVKFTLADSWRSVANSVQETNRIESVERVYVVFGKMGGVPDVRWAEYEQSVVHVRTSHVPRFEVDVSANRSLFAQMGVAYDDFRRLPMHDKMAYIRRYARGRLKEGERLWWLEDSPDASHSLPIQARLYTSLTYEEKRRLRAEAALLCPQIVRSGGAKHKYDDVVLYMLTYHGVVCHQARDLFSAGSVANPNNDDRGGLYIQRALMLLEDAMQEAAYRMEDALFVEYWGESVAQEARIRRWLEKADALATGWKPSDELFQEQR